MKRLEPIDCQDSDGTLSFIPSFTSPSLSLTGLSLLRGQIRQPPHPEIPGWCSGSQPGKGGGARHFIPLSMPERIVACHNWGDAADTWEGEVRETRLSLLPQQRITGLRCQWCQGWEMSKLWATWANGIIAVGTVARQLIGGRVSEGTSWKNDPKRPAGITQNTWNCDVPIMTF